MVRKTTQSADAGERSGAQLAGTVKESAQQIWLAGLGAFAKAQEEGGKVFEALVREGLTLQRKTQVAAEEKFSEASTRMASMAADLSTRASGRWDKLEGIFEERVSRALNKLGVPSSKDIDMLVARIDELNRTVAQLSGRAVPAAKGAGRGAASGAKATAKSAARSAAKGTAKTAAKGSAGGATRPAARRAAKKTA